MWADARRVERRLEERGLSENLCINPLILPDQVGIMPDLDSWTGRS